MAPRLVIAANSQSFDQVTISHWQEEGYEVRFEPVRDESRSSIRSIESISDTLNEGQKYAIVSSEFCYIAVMIHNLSRPHRFCRSRIIELTSHR